MKPSAYIFGLTVFVVCALAAGVAFDMGYQGIATAFGCIVALDFMVMLQRYLDKGVTDS